MIVSLLLALMQTPTVLDPGVYRSRGYGWVLASRQGFDLYHEAGLACWPEPDPDGADVASAFARSTARPDGGFGLTEAGSGPSTVYVMDPIGAVPRACLSPDTSDRAAVVALADLMTAYYPAFEVRGVDFEARRAAVLAGLPSAPTPDQAFAAATALLDGLADPHLSLDAEIDGEARALAVSEGPTLDAIHARDGDRPERAWLADWRAGIEQTLLQGQGHVAANNRVFWGRRGEVGYLAVVTMGGFDPEDDAATEPFDAALDEAMAAFAGAKAVIVDVSNNRGGYDAVSLRLASRFADRSRLAYAKRGWASGVEAQPIMVQPSERPRYLGPVWVLTSDITVSAGETFTQMMRVLPNVTLAGTPGRGAFSDQTPVPLANDWDFAMPMELYLDPDGHPLEGHGLQPDVVIDLYPAVDRDQGHAVAVARLMDRIERTGLNRPARLADDGPASGR